MVKPNPLKGTGVRDQECSNYKACLSVAAKHNWPAFNCEECEVAYSGFEPEAEDEEFLDSETEEDEGEEGEGDEGEGENDESEGDGSAEDGEPGDGEACRDCGKVAILQAGLCPECAAGRAGASTKPEVAVKPEPSTGLKLCVDCGERPVMGPNHQVCRPCLGRRGQQRLREKEAAAKAGAASQTAQGAARTAQGGLKGFAAKDIPADLNPCQGRGFMDLTCPWFAVCRGRFDLATDLFFRCERCRIFQDRIRMYFGVSANRAETAPTAALAASSGSPSKVDSGPSASAVMVDFAEHGGILEAARRRAVEEIRSLPHQIIFMVKTALGQ